MGACLQRVSARQLVHREITGQQRTVFIAARSFWQAMVAAAAAILATLMSQACKPRAHIGLVMKRHSQLYSRQPLVNSTHAGAAGLLHHAISAFVRPSPFCIPFSVCHAFRAAPGTRR